MKNKDSNIFLIDRSFLAKMILNSAYLLCLALCFVGFHVESKKVLLIAPPAGSHLLQANSIAEGLIARGHDVAVVVDVNAKSLNKLLHPKVRQIKYDLGREIIFNTRAYQEPLITMELEDSSWLETHKTVGNLFQMLMNECKLFLGNADLFKKLKEENFDFVLIDGFLKCYVLMPHRLGVPFASFMAFLPPDIPNTALQAPLIVPGPIDGLLRVGSMPRVFTTIFRIIFAMGNAKVFDRFEEYSDVPVSAIFRETKLWLYDKSRFFDSPMPVSPNVIYVGGLNIRKPENLSDVALKNFVDTAENGFILVCFGSFAKYFPDKIVNTLLETFIVLPYKFVWKFDKETLKPGVDVPENVLMTKWLPQNDLLAHKNIKLFITHAGNSGQHEALYNAVPMVAIPLFGDQLYNSGVIQEKKFGLMIRLKYLTKEKLISCIKTVISNPGFRSSIEKASAQFRNEPMSPLQRAAYWIDRVMQHGADHLQSQTNDLPWYQILMIDVLFVVVVAVTCCFAVIILIILCLYQCVRAKPVKKKQS